MVGSVRISSLTVSYLTHIHEGWGMRVNSESIHPDWHYFLRWKLLHTDNMESWNFCWEASHLNWHIVPSACPHALDVGSHVEGLPMLLEPQWISILLLQGLVSAVDGLLGDVSHRAAHCKLEGPAQCLEAEPWPGTQSCCVVLLQWVRGVSPSLWTAERHT